MKSKEFITVAACSLIPIFNPSPDMLSGNIDLPMLASLAQQTEFIPTEILEQQHAFLTKFKNVFIPQFSSQPFTFPFAEQPEPMTLPIYLENSLAEYSEDTQPTMESCFEIFKLRIFMRALSQNLSQKEDFFSNQIEKKWENCDNFLKEFPIY